MQPAPVNIWTLQGMRQVNETLADAALLGITVCAASGDDGSSNGVEDGKAHVLFPASSPYVLAIGGTKIPLKGGTGPDVVWKEGDGLRTSHGTGGSSGGGVSAFFPRPTWQRDVTVQSINPDGIVGRCIPDISANADGDWSPYFTVANGKEPLQGGTSASTPLIAGLLTLINASRPIGNRVGYLTPVLYQIDKASGKAIGALGCTDVTVGNNNIADVGGYAA